MAQSSHLPGRSPGPLEQAERDAERAIQRDRALAKARRAQKRKRRESERRARREAASHLRSLRAELAVENGRYDSLRHCAERLAQREVYDREEDEGWDRVSESHARINSLGAEIRQLEAQLNPDPHRRSS